MYFYNVCKTFSDITICHYERFMPDEFEAHCKEAIQHTGRNPEEIIEWLVENKDYDFLDYEAIIDLDHDLK